MLGCLNDLRNSHSLRNLSVESVEARLAVGISVRISLATACSNLMAQGCPFSSPLNTEPNAPLPMGLSLNKRRSSDIYSLLAALVGFPIKT